MVCDFEYKQMSTKNLCVDTSYQRDVDTKRVRSIVRKFNPCLVHAIKVSKRDGRYYVFDGQHTLEALKLKNKGFDTYAWCQVFTGLTWLDEVELFLEQNGESRAVHMNDKFRARMNAGDPQITRMVRIAEKVGFTIDFKGGQGDNKIIALTTLARIFNHTTDKEYERILRLLKKTWHGAKESICNEMLRGMFVFMNTYGDQVDDKFFVKQLEKVSPILIVRDGKVSSTGGDTRFARQILTKYNERARTHRLPDLL